MTIFKLIYILFFTVVMYFFPFHSVSDRLIACALGYGGLGYISFYLVRATKFYRFLTFAVSILLSLSVLLVLSSVLRVDFSLTADRYWVEIIFTLLAFFAVYFALLIGATSNYFKRKTTETKMIADKHLIDTSAIIDGRLLDIAQSGFAPRFLVIPQFVIRELQLISDSPNHEKRSKGRRGLDMLKQMTASEHMTVEIITQDAPEATGVDSKLLALAKRLKNRIITTDFNLVKVAQVEGVQVLNINQLATLIRSNLNVSDRIRVFVSKKGNNRNQGVAFLPDDTMVIIEDAEKFIGDQKTVSINSYIQNESGRIAFARIVNN